MTTWALVTVHRGTGELSPYLLDGAPVVLHAEDLQAARRAALRLDLPPTVHVVDASVLRGAA